MDNKYKGINFESSYLDLLEKTQYTMNEIATYSTEIYIESFINAKDLYNENLDECSFNNIAKNYFHFAMKLIWGGTLPTLFEIMMQNYYESKMLSLSSSNEMEANILICVRLQMLFVLQGSKLLHMGKRDEYINFAQQATSNLVFKSEDYRKILISN